MANGKWQMEEKKLLPFHFPFAIFHLPLLAVLVAGCASNDPGPTTRPSSVRDRQEAALEDPFGYSPNMNENDISGGKLHEMDRGAMRKDIDHVLNP